MKLAPAAPAPPRFLTVSIAGEIGLLLALSLMFPLLVHILPVPEDTRLGPRLLPMFYAPLLAALLGRSHPAVSVALGAPWLNWMITSHPSPRGAVLMTVELLVFVMAIRAWRARSPHWFVAAPAYIVCIAAATLLVFVFPVLIDGAAPLA